MKLNNATPSYFANYNSATLPNSVMQLLPIAYLEKDSQGHTDPFVSPLLASDELIKELPPIRMMIGTHDVFYDESCRLLARLMYYLV